VTTKIIPFLILIFAMTAVGWSHSRVPHAASASLGEDFIPTPHVAQAMAFGFDALLADYHWLQAVQVAGGQDVIGSETARELGQRIDVVTFLNPHVGHPYRFAAVWLTHDPEQVREGIRLLHRATEYHPDDWRNYFYIAFNHFFYLGEYEEAASILEAALDLPGRPSYLQRLVARLKSQEGDVEVAEVFLRELYQSSSDEEEKARMQIALDEIEIEYRARHLDRARDAYRELAGKDIDSVEDLTREPFRILERLPDAEPSAIPRALRRGSVWEIDPDTDQIESSYLGNRYEVHYAPQDRRRLEEWKAADESGSTEHREEPQGNG
jgi:tetratricopeptide (TPR) repeat protein